MQPGAERISHPERAGLLDEYEEGRLEGVVCVVDIRKPGAADAHHHRTVTLHERREGQFGSLAVPGREPLQQLPVREFAKRPQVEERVEFAEDCSITPVPHRSDPRPGLASLLIAGN